MARRRLLALTAAVLVGTSCASQQGERAPSPSTPTGHPESRENGDLVFKGPRFTAWLVAPDGSDLRSVPLPDSTATVTPWGYSPDGTQIVYNGYERGDSGDYAIYVSDGDGRDLSDLTSTYLDPNENNQGEPVWSPDSTQIAFDNDSEDASTGGIYLMNADGTDIHKVVDGGFPAWSPDGERIAFVAASDEGNDIFSVSADGSDVKQLTHSDASDGLPTWSHDGSLIAFIEGGQVWVMDTDGGEAHAVSDIPNDGIGGFSPDWSPDGKTIAFEVFDHGSWNIYTVHPDGSGLRPLADDPGDEIQPVWSPDGSLIAYMASPEGSGGFGDNTGTFDVYASRPDGTDLTRITKDAGGAGGSLAWQPILP
jgi:TolB protein